ncbi:efflux transporter outer membrane subunit [Phenylobacterium sp.]|uniref:efflux transporter outer membrane subunit n=1 Tax=Phenylobacterium sp. TaxID=1871053 RepID=UPI001220AC88|nr:efflux transporter outer membrane subunit [Phenylobacterium sp.]THD50708.1 MAG: efflux transporter outer membrane subunit [Phenylobacterium sp.]
MAERQRRLALPVLAALGGLGLAACAVGPNFKTPAAPMVQGYTAQPLAPAAATPGVAAGEAQTFASGADIAGDWWTLFHSQPINDLVTQALAANPDLKAAQAALSAAHETTLSQRGAYYPQVSAGYSATRQRQSGALAPTPADNASQFNLFTPQVSVSYALDVFGLTRRTVESAKAQEQSVRFQMIAAHLTLTSNVVVAAINDASLRAQIDATRQLIDIETQSVEILKHQADKGYASRIDVAAQETQLAQAAASLPPLLKQAAQLHDQLAVLIGKLPSEAAVAKIDIASLQLPADLPVTLPSKLVEQRPDVRQAEANLHAASAQIGVAEANRFPNIQLSAMAGNTAIALSQAFTPGTNFWSLGAAATMPIFEGGTLLHQERAAKATYEQAAQQYRSTVLGAFQNVADSLSAIQQDADGLKASALAAEAAKVTLDLTQRQMQDGYASGLALLNAQQAYQQARIALVQAQAARFADTAALFQSLGGGWWRRPDLAKDANAN